MNQPEASPQSQTLSRELSVFLVQFSVGLHKAATYPSNHPVVQEAINSAYLQLLALLTERDLLALGVARNQLIVEGAATDTQSAVLSELAERLHRHQVGAIRFTNGVSLDEFTSLLTILCREANREEVPFGLRPQEDLDRWQHIKVVPLTFDELQLADGEDAAASGSRQSQLWLGLAAAALREDADDSESVSSTSPEEVAKAITGRKGDRTYDQVIVGYLSQLGKELKLREGADAKALQEQVTALLSTLDKSTLKRLLEVGGGLAARNDLLADLSATLPVEAVMDLIKAAAETGGQTISHSFLRMLSKLADHAETGSGTMKPHADQNFRGSIQSLLDDWSLEDPNPEAYTAVLERLAAAGDHDASYTSDTASESRRIIEMGMEVSVFGATVAHAIDEMLASGRFQELLEIIDAAPEASTAPEETWSYLSSPERVQLLLAHDEHDVEGVQRVLERLGSEAAGPLLDALATAASRAMRHRLLSTLTALGSSVGPLAAQRLPTAEWYVQRNLLILLGSLPEWPEGFSPEPYAKANDPRVRREAIKLLLQSADSDFQDMGKLLGVADDDASIVRMALTAAGGGCPPKAERSVLALLEAEDDDVRLLAIRVLGHLKTSRCRAALLERVLAKRKWWQRRPRLAGPTPEMIAALTGLADNWAEAEEVKPVLDLARQSSHEGISNVVSGP